MVRRGANYVPEQTPEGPTGILKRNRAATAAPQKEIETAGCFLGLRIGLAETRIYSPK
jgi:hypothetical protein